MPDPMTLPNMFDDKPVQMTDVVNHTLQALTVIDELNKRSRSWVIQDPPDPEYDPDLILKRALREQMTIITDLAARNRYLMQLAHEALANLTAVRFQLDKMVDQVEATVITCKNDPDVKPLVEENSAKGESNNEGKASGPDGEDRRAQDGDHQG